MDELKEIKNKLSEIIVDINRQLTKQQREDWPQEGDIYWYVNDCGIICDSEYDNCNMDKEIKNFLGIFRTEEEAEQARDYYKAIRIIDEYIKKNYSKVYKNSVDYIINRMANTCTSNILELLKQNGIDIDTLI